MKIVVSSYNKLGEESLTLFSVNLRKKVYHKLDGLFLYEPSFCCSYQGYVFTYDKMPLRIKVYKVFENKLKAISEIKVEMNTMTHLVFSSKNKRLYGVSYLDGAYISVDFINEKLQNLKVYRQGGKCHCVCINKCEDEVAIVNIEQNKIYYYDADLNYKKSIELDNQVGPRHAVYHNDSLYVITEYSNEIIKIKHDKVVNKISTLRKEIKSYGATLFIIDNKLYASNRGEDDIVVFKINENLDYHSSFSCNGNHPRHMIKTNDESLVISCNKNSNNISIINIKSQKEIMSIPYKNVSSVCEI